MNKYCRKFDVKIKEINCFEFCIERDLEEKKVNANNCLEIFITFDQNVEESEYYRKIARHLQSKLKSKKLIRKTVTFEDKIPVDSSTKTDTWSIALQLQSFLKNDIR